MKPLFFCLFLLAGLSLKSQCYPDQHSTDWTSAWYACKAAASPNKVRKDGHWLMIDLGKVRKITKSHFWNFNYPDQLESGIAKMEIDYSVDGANWTFFKRIELPKASGLPRYEGLPGPDFNVEARYVLLSVVETWGHPCAGLSEISFVTEQSAQVTPIREVFNDPICLSASVFPNPFMDRVNLSVEGNCQEPVSWMLTDVAGRLLKKSTLPLYPPQVLDLDFKNLQPGVYFFTLSNGKTMRQEKLVKIE